MIDCIDKVLDNEKGNMKGVYRKTLGLFMLSEY